jgi:hypothetical protein
MTRDTVHGKQPRNLARAGRSARRFHRCWRWCVSALVVAPGQSRAASLMPVVSFAGNGAPVGRNVYNDPILLCIRRVADCSVSASTALVHARPDDAATQSRSMPTVPINAWASSPVGRPMTKRAAADYSTTTTTTYSSSIIVVWRVIASSLVVGAPGWRDRGAIQIYHIHAPGN